MNNDNQSSFKSHWGIVMGLIYIVIAYFVIFTNRLLPYNFEDNLKDDDQFAIVRIFLGVAMCAYGVFRFYKSLKEIRK